MPRETLHELKAFASVTKQFQYTVVAQALEQYLADGAEGLSAEDKATLAELKAALDPAKAQASDPAPPWATWRNQRGPSGAVWQPPGPS